MKDMIKKISTTAFAVCMLFSAAACNTTGSTGGSISDSTPTAKTEYSYLAIDINPSMELVLKDELVVSVKACNDDAAVLLSGEDFTDMTVEEVSESIVVLAEELGYLTEENDAVKITVVSDDETLTKKWTT